MVNWTDTHRQCYNKLKQLVASAPVLKYYDVNADVTISSSTGLGAVLLQNSQPMAFASKALTETQKKYAQIEKEMLGILFGCTKFHDYIFGKTLTVETDHKPIDVIYKKPLYLAPVRLQRMIMKLQRYDIRVQYKKGSELYFADTLSRAHLPYVSKDLDEELEISMVLAVSEQKLTQIRQETDNDESLKILKNVIKEGWPETRSELHANVQDF